MKLRDDFVSNSSSCSFIIKVNTDDEISQLQRYFSSLDMKGICTSGFPSLEYAASEWYNSMTSINPKSVEPGECLYVNVGEDHDFSTIDKFDVVASEIEKMGLELYADPGAHYSIGKDLPENED